MNSRTRRSFDAAFLSKLSEARQTATPSRRQRSLIDLFLSLVKPNK